VEPPTVAVVVTQLDKRVSATPSTESGSPPRRLRRAGKCANIVPVSAPICGRGSAKGHRETVYGKDNSSERLAAHLPTEGEGALLCARAGIMFGSLQVAKHIVGRIET
jgi:hypothetical protein